MVETVTSTPQRPRLGRYELLERLGRGGMAEVFKARLCSMHGVEKVVALKRILPGVQLDPRFVKLFVREAQLSARLMHPNLIQIFEFGQEGSQLYLAMELVEGCDLRRVLEAQAALGKPMPTELAVCIALGMLQGLDHAHRLTGEQGQLLNVVHRDLSPSNVLLSYSGAIKVSDFGVAHMDGPERSDTNLIKGKVAYMAPEQFTGDAIDPRLDVFAAACVLYEMLAGGPVYGGLITPALVRKVSRGEVPRVRESLPRLPVALADLVQRGLDPNRDRRIPTCDRFVAELRAVVQSGQVRAAHESELALYLQVLIPRPTKPPVARPPSSLANLFDGVGLTGSIPPLPLEGECLSVSGGRGAAQDEEPLLLGKPVAAEPSPSRRTRASAWVALLLTVAALFASRWPEVRTALTSALLPRPTPVMPGAIVAGEPPGAMRLSVPVLHFEAPRLDPAPVAPPAPKVRKSGRKRVVAKWEQ